MGNRSLQNPGAAIGQMARQSVFGKRIHIAKMRITTCHVLVHYAGHKRTLSCFERSKKDGFFTVDSEVIEEKFVSQV